MKALSDRAPLNTPAAGWGQQRLASCIVAVKLPDVGRGWARDACRITIASLQCTPARSDSAKRFRYHAMSGCHLDVLGTSAPAIAASKGGALNGLANIAFAPFTWACS